MTHIAGSIAAFLFLALFVAPVVLYVVGAIVGGAGRGIARAVPRLLRWFATTKAGAFFALLIVISVLGNLAQGAPK